MPRPFRNRAVRTAPCVGWSPVRSGDRPVYGPDVAARAGTWRRAAHTTDANYQLAQAAFAVGWWWPGQFGKPGIDVRLPSPRAAQRWA